VIVKLKQTGQGVQRFAWLVDTEFGTQFVPDAAGDGIEASTSLRAHLQLAQDAPLPVCVELRVDKRQFEQCRIQGVWRR